ncbi:hypothetical protein MTsPCn9_16050 [Croceitalea sp. MTPC9]|uniref:hypothetical protein n=1 Tax=unclassified Croceitalea TaxID=2632280 RepID=UPI002B3D4C71|nr:hypothetical protein MTsPCn6_08900 [Croceitalea sp. MTPC6]GMN16669.1 hypothetical protein MTsPCn9_16050 [Croceitalea sp. MTPC9]
MLNNIKMNVTKTAKDGIVNQETIFHFKQSGKTVDASYFGGKIKKGYLVGLLEDSILKFSYCQLRITGETDHGISKCRLSKDPNTSKIMMTESFKMQTENSNDTGTNVFMEI